MPTLLRCTQRRVVTIRDHTGGRSKLDRLLRIERGQGLVEYALIFALVILVVIGVLILLGPAIGNAFSNIKNSI
jgi:pilus assembly protein Flp/PilA